MYSKNAKMSGWSSSRFDIYKIDNAGKGDTDFSDKSWSFLSPDRKSLGWSDTVASDPYDRYGLESETSIATGDVRNPKDCNKLPFGWIERIAPKTKECYFYDQTNRKVYYTLPPKDCREVERVGWNGVAGKYHECNYRYILRCRHILVKHNESDRCSSYRTRLMKRTKEEALHKITQARDLISTGKVGFAELAKGISDCCSARHGGDLGPLKLTQTSYGFEKKLVRLKINELSDIFETKAGYHILLRTAVNNEKREFWTKHRHLKNKKGSIGKDKFKTYKKGTQQFSRFVDQWEPGIYNLLGQRHTIRDSESNFSHSSSILCKEPSLPFVSDSAEKSKLNKLRLYTQQKHLIRKKIIQQRLDKSVTLGEFLKSIETDGLGNSVVKDHKLKKDLFIKKGIDPKMYKRKR
ncbi:uncharacterized protein LOC119553391 [Drosophila subpulchrella]|uniref:uncharacterized protein LOC119553391 n=1 Tax=Drosophila subpulchrella TaxID=1486046 RepID=UPI0018A1420B|nr:uncharacterized protein LOC119553391 [Drosophila subpulchrella]